MDVNPKKRVSVKIKTPNPLFVKWITEWKDEAKQKESKMQYCFKNALQSLKKYPLPLESGKDCKILKGFGDKLCAMLDQKLKSHKVNPSPPEVNNKIESPKKVKNTQIKKHVSVDSVTSKNKKIEAPSLKKCASSTSVSTSTGSEDNFVLAPNSFDIILLVDTQETGRTNNESDPLLKELKRLNVQHEIHNLKVGDYTWICRDKSTNIDLVLPYIIERKRMDDFASSIKDGRYREQKFRLKRSGIKNITYLIESYGNNDKHVGLPLATLYQAATNTAIQDGFCIKFTGNLQGTAEYLGCFSTLITNIFKSKTLISCKKEDLSDFSVNDDIIPLITLKEFNHSSTKIKKLTADVHLIKSLIQIKGLSVEKAMAIVEKYPTPKLLYDAYQENSGPEGEKLLSNIQFGSTKKNIGAVISKIVYQLFNNDF